MIEAITFDFWNTIARAPAGRMSEARQRAIAAACEGCGVEVEADRLAELLDQVTLSYERSWSRGTHFYPRQGAEILVRGLGLDGAASGAVAEAFLSAGRNAELEFAPGAGAGLEALASRGARLGIVCDVGFTGGEMLRGLIEREGLLRHFSGWAFSDEVGHYKPAPQIFEAALAALGSEPSAAMHVGDLRRTDIAGAAALGMKTARYRALHDDPGDDAEVEADFVVDSHAELVALVDSLQ